MAVIYSRAKKPGAGNVANVKTLPVPKSNSNSKSAGGKAAAKKGGAE